MHKALLALFMFMTIFVAKASADVTATEARAALLAIQSQAEMESLEATATAAQARYDGAIATLATPRITTAMNNMAINQATIDALSVAKANGATVDPQIATATANFDAAKAIASPAIMQAETAGANLAAAEFDLANANEALALLVSAITASPTPTDLSAVNAEIALLRQQVNSLAGADADLTAQVADLEALTSNAEAFLRRICPNMKHSYTDVCLPFTPAVLATP